MKFFEKINRFFGNIKVTEKNNQIKVTGIDALVMRKHIATYLETDAVSKHMFTTMTDTSFSIGCFFLPDLVYILTKLKEQPHCKWSVKTTVEKLLYEISQNTWFGKTLNDPVPIVDKSRIRKMLWKPMEKQLEFLHLYGDRIPRYDLNGYILAFGPGGGKATALDSLIRTPSGWVLNRDIKLGQTISAPDGTTTKVTGIYPQGLKPLYRVYFEDDRWLDCCEEHLWKVYTKQWNRSAAPWRVISLGEILNYLTMPTMKTRLYVPLPEPEIKDDVSLPLDPYILGVILGDGSISHPKQISVCKPDKFIREELGRLLPNGLTVSDYRPDGQSFGFLGRELSTGKSIRDLLTELELVGTYSYTKFIPKLYFEASYSQKLALLQGLMDTDGHVGEHCSIQYSTTSERMAYQIQELVRSIGGLCKLKTKIPHFIYKGERKEGRLAYILQIRIKDPKTIFRLLRKKDKLSENYQYKDSLRLRISSIEPIGEHEAQCISVDHPEHLYIADDYIVTHNTYTDLLVATCVIPPSVAEVKIIISPKKALHLVWEKSVKAVFKKQPTYWCSDSSEKMPLTNCEYYIFNFEAIGKAIELGNALKSRNVRFFVIVDESHNFADPKSARSQQLVKLQTLAPKTFFIWTTGTPILKSAAELTSFLKCADPRFDDEAERRFRRIYQVAPGRANEIFNHRLGNMMAFLVPKSAFSKTKPITKELPIRLPPAMANRFLMSTVREDMKAFIVERLKFYETEMKSLRHIVNTWLEWHRKTLRTKPEKKNFDTYIKNIKIISQNPDLFIRPVLDEARDYERRVLIPNIPPRERKQFRSALSAIKNIKLKVRGEALGKILGPRRSECAAALGLYCKPDEIMKDSLSKTLFFASSVYPIKVLHEFLSDKGFNPLLVYGGTNSQLVQIMEAFEENPTLNPVCATMQSLSEAVPVTAASTVVLLNRPFRQAVYEQVVARADRIGQIHQVTVVEATLDTGDEPNVSSTTDHILNEVRSLINEIVGEEFSGPNPEDREYQEVIDASEEDPILALTDDKLGL